MTYKPCPECTYPLKELYLDETHRRIICTNKRCEYTRLIRKHKPKNQRKTD